MRKCDRIHPKLADYLEGGLGRWARARVAAHLRACAVCRAEVAALERTGAVLKAVGLESAPAGSWEAVRREIEREERARARPRPRLAWGAAMGALALVLVLVTALVLRPRQLAAPPVVVVADVDEEMELTMRGHLSAVWVSPLADEAAVGLRLAALGEDG